MDNQIQITNKEQLITLINHGNKVRYLFFWGHRQHKAGLTSSCFSQWYSSPFTVAEVEYSTAEHYMMAEKARLFGDTAALKKIIGAAHPREAKKIGRRVKSFDEKLWCQQRMTIVVNGNLAKFSQHPQLKAFLINSGNRILVEASPVDTIWGHRPGG